MAKVKEVAVRASYLKSLPNYENIRVEAEAVVTIEEGDSVKDTYDKAWDMVGQQITEQLALFSDVKKSGIKKGL